MVSGLTRDLKPGERLMVDANQGWDLDDARVAVRELGGFGLGFIEEPIPANRPSAEWAELAMLSLSLSPVPLAGGENDVMENPLREALAQPFPRLRDGLFPLPDAPGLGAEPDLEAAAEWLVTRMEHRAPR